MRISWVANDGPIASARIIAAVNASSPVAHPAHQTRISSPCGFSESIRGTAFVDNSSQISGSRKKDVTLISIPLMSASSSPGSRSSREAYSLIVRLPRSCMRRWMRRSSVPRL